jgi:hypothetical protein
MNHPSLTAKWLLHYTCPACEECWTDFANALTFQDCPECGRERIAPYSYTDAVLLRAEARRNRDTREQALASRSSLTPLCPKAEVAL